MNISSPAHAADFAAAHRWAQNKSYVLITVWVMLDH